MYNYYKRSLPRDGKDVIEENEKKAEVVQNVSGYVVLLIVSIN